MGGKQWNDSVFAEYSPVKWEPHDKKRFKGKKIVYSVSKFPVIKTSYSLHNPNDSINRGRSDLEKILLEYKSNDITYALLLKDLFQSDFDNLEKRKNLVFRDITERFARGMMDSFLETYSSSGKKNGITPSDFQPGDNEEFIVAHNSEYILKYHNYPNLLILKKSADGEGIYGYKEVRKEIDGLFDYTYMGQRNILIVESIHKQELEHNRVPLLINDLYEPLRQLFPNTYFSYVLIGDRELIFEDHEIHKQYNLLTDTSEDICLALSKENINVMFVPFQQRDKDFKNIFHHLKTQYSLLNDKHASWNGRIESSPDSLTVFDHGETPHRKFYRDGESWREVDLVHKNVELKKLRRLW